MISIDKMKEYYNSNFWSEKMLKTLVEKEIITEEQYKKITGKSFKTTVRRRRKSIVE